MPSPHRIAMGFTIGVFFAFAMLIIPLQMLFSAFTCIYFKGNLPIALGACWISNPLTIPPLVIAMMWVGGKFDHFVFDMPECKSEFFTKITEALGLGFEVDFAHLFFGCVFTGIILALITYPITFAVMKLYVGRRKHNQAA